MCSGRGRVKARVPLAARGCRRAASPHEFRRCGYPAGYAGRPVLRPRDADLDGAAVLAEDPDAVAGDLRDRLAEAPGPGPLQPQLEDAGAVVLDAERAHARQPPERELEVMP